MRKLGGVDINATPEESSINFGHWFMYAESGLRTSKERGTKQEEYDGNRFSSSSQYHVIGDGGELEGETVGENKEGNLGLLGRRAGSPPGRGAGTPCWMRVSE
jgi:hypothetical protein